MPTTPQIYTLSLHDALPISAHVVDAQATGGRHLYDGPVEQIVGRVLCGLGLAGSAPEVDGPVVVGKQPGRERSEEHMSELQSHSDLVCRLLLEKKKKINKSE